MIIIEKGETHHITGTIRIRASLAPKLTQHQSHLGPIQTRHESTWVIFLYL
jgi:hypothetical protein